MSKIKIGKRTIGDGCPTFIIAEIGMNHNGDVKLAKKIIKAAADCGCDAAKFQIFTAEKLVTKDAETYGNQDGHLPKYQQEMYKKHELTKDDYNELKQYCDKLGLVFFGSVWDEENADLLEEVGGEIFKFGSMDITHLPLLEHVAKKGKPIMLSVGMSTMDEVEEAVKAIIKHNKKLMLLHCVSSYPAKAEDTSMLSMIALKEKFGFPVGFSDHTPDVLTDTVAVALGANIIEKHFTIDKKLPGVDHFLSFEPHEMKRMVQEVRLVEKMLGKKELFVKECELETRMMARRSVIAKVNIPKGTVITKDMLIIKRPGTGLHPRELHNVIGKKAKKHIKEDELIAHEHLE
ncbi:N-acetylneuraminate synthase family protein [Candidatus Woesearchaeota archaeon]|nr:N-acetylneuraminate synthase family protein [Candidatus Woesearchaeota archaeon]